MIGQTLNNRYKITKLLGQGGMGEVYLAIDEKSKQEVAVKILARQLVTNQGLIDRFKREAETLQKLEHPNIVKFIDAFENESQYVIVMEYVSGGNLQDLIKQGRLPIEDAKRIALELCDALIRSHHLNIIHRDIKPENVLLTDDGKPKLADFGVARLNEGSHMTRTGTQVGTPFYMSPEAWEGKSLNAQTDIWSLGVMLFEMLTGQVPFEGDTGAVVMNKVLTSQPPDINKLRKEVPIGIANIVVGMLVRDKKQRYESIRQVAADLEKGKSSITIVHTPNNSKTVITEKPRKLRFGIIGIVVLALVVLWGISNNLNLFSSNSTTQLASTLSSTPKATLVEFTFTPTVTLSPTVSPTPTPTQIPTSVLRPDNIENLTMISEFGKHANSLAFSPDSKYIVAGGMLDNTVRIWDVETGEMLQEFIGHSKSVEIVAFSPLGDMVASGSSDNTVRLWDISTQSEIFSLTDENAILSNGINGIDFSPDGRLLAWSPSGFSINTLLSRIANGTLLRKLDGYFLAFSPDGNYILTTLGVESVQLQLVNDGTFIFSLEGHTDNVRTAAFSADGNFIVTAGSNDRRLALWNAKDGSLLNIFVGGYAGYADNVAFSIDNKIIVSGGWDRGSTKFWDHDGNLLRTISAGSCFAFSPDGKLFATCIGGKIQIWTIP